jgi:hypothetical protein
VRSQMNLRICFRVRERRDVDLILGQGMLNAAWHAHTLNAPGKFLISSPEHDTPRRARISQDAIQPSDDPRAEWDEGGTDANEEDQEPASGDTADAAELLWFALGMAPAEGTGIGELMRITGMSRPTPDPPAHTPGAARPPARSASGSNTAIRSAPRSPSPACGALPAAAPGSAARTRPPPTRSPPGLIQMSRQFRCHSGRIRLARVGQLVTCTNSPNPDIFRSPRLKSK